MFWTGIWKQCCHIWNQHPQICLFGKLHEKAKMLKFWAQGCLFRIVLVWNLETIFPYFKLATSNLFVCKISLKTKVPKYGTIFIRLETCKCFEAGIRKQYSYIWNQHPRICLVGKFGKQTKKKTLKFEIKNVLFWVYFRKNFKNTIIIFKIVIL